MLLNKWLLMVWVLVMGASASLQAASDPTRPPFMVKQSAKKTHKPLKLSMILSEGTQRKAIINESVVAESDSVEGATVIKINEDSVVVRRAGKNIKLTMPLAVVRKDGNHDE